MPPRVIYQAAPPVSTNAAVIQRADAPSLSIPPKPYRATPCRVAPLTVVSLSVRSPAAPTSKNVR